MLRQQRGGESEHANGTCLESSGKEEAPKVFSCVGRKVKNNSISEGQQIKREGKGIDIGTRGERGTPPESRRKIGDQVMKGGNTKRVPIEKNRGQGRRGGVNGDQCRCS